MLERLRNLFRRESLSAELEEELQFHIAARADELMRDGLAREQAEAQARRQLGHSLLLREESRAAKLFPRIDSILQDAQYGVRQLRKNPAVTAAAALSLSLAIGACTAAFALIDALILRPLPVRDPERLIYAFHRAPNDPIDLEYFSYPLFERMREASFGQARLFGMSYLTRYEVTFDDAAGERERVYPQWVSADAFDVLGVKPSSGRMFAAADEAAQVAVVSHEFWKRRFGSSPSALGRWVTLRDKPYQIVGVAQRGFTGVEPGFMTDLWVPLKTWPNLDAGTNWFRLWARLAPGVSPAVFRELLQSVSANWQRERTSSETNRPLYVRQAANGPSRVRQSFGRPLWVLGGIALLVLLIACANVASLLVARTAARNREMALRISIGAGRGRLVQQVLIESALLASAACLGGVLVAVAAAPVVVSMLSTSTNTIRLDLHYDWRVLAFLGVAGLAVTVLFGLVPALRASSVSPNDALKTGGTRQSASSGFFRPLVAAQTAVGFVVIFVAGLFLASFDRLVRSDVGFEPKRLMIASIEAKGLRRDTARPVWQQVLERVRRQPGVEAASLSAFALFEGPETATRITIPGHAPTVTPLMEVSPEFFATMGIRLLTGRAFEWNDTEANVIVNESFAQRHFPGESAVGKSFLLNRTAAQIVGVVRDARYKSIRSPAPPTLYLPSLPSNAAALQLRTHLDPAALQRLVRDEVARTSAALRLVDITPQSTFIDNVLVQERVLAVLSGFFSAVAILLVAVGLYGVLSYSVVQRTREIGIRIALGSTPPAIVRRVLSEAGAVTAAGIALGIPAALAAARLVTALLYDVKPSSFWSIAAPLGCLALAAALPSLIPAIRASRVDPMSALRVE